MVRKPPQPWLTTEELGDLKAVSETRLRQVLDDDAFGKFAILQRSDDEFIQAACAWDPSPECTAFLEQQGSDPWGLEYRDGMTGVQYRAAGLLTLTQVRDAFVAYLAGTPGWRTAHTWEVVAHGP